MIKKIIASFLMVVAVICGINFGIANTTTNTAYAAESDASAFKVASVSPYDLYPTGTEANVPLKIMEGDDEICTIMIDPGLTLVTNYSASYSSLRILKNSTVKIIPNESFSIKKIFMQAHNNSNASTAIAIDAAQGTRINYKNLPDDEKTLLGNPSNSMSVAPFEINDEYVATEETPYVMTTSMQFYLKTIHVVYEKNQKDYTQTYDCTNDRIGSPATVKVGDATFLIRYEGSLNNGYPAYGHGSFKITIYPVPGYVINYVIFTSSIDNPFEASELDFPGLEATYENGNLKVTGMQPGQTYELSSDGGAKGLLTSITVNYIEHEHTGVYEPGSDETHHFKQCECLWRVDEEEHVFGEGEITLEPTHQRKGKAKYTCTIAECGYEKEEQVAPNFADTEVSLDKELRYNGSIQFALYTVKYKGYVVGLSNYKVVSGVARGKEPGDYTFTIGPKDGSIFEGTKEFTFTIKKGSVAKPALDTTEFYFDNTVKTYTVENSEFYTVLDNSNQQTNPGSYKVKIALSNPDYYEWEDGTTDTLEYDFVINKGNYDMEKVVFNDLEVTYDGEEHSIIATNLPDGVTVSYEDNVGTNAGTYNAIAKFTGNLDYYNPIDNKTATLTINKAVVTAPTADTTVFTYNGQAQTYALQTNSLYTISNTTFTDAGNHTVTVALVDKTNYKWDNGNSDDLTFSFVIGKATYDMSGVVFADKTVVYNGTAFSIEATNLPDGVTVAYENNAQTNAGEYIITAKFTGNANYNAIANKTATLTIAKATYDMSGVVFADKTVIYNGTAFSIEATNLPDGVTVAYENNAQTNAGEYIITAKFTGNANYNEIADMTATLTINKATYDMSGVVFADKAVVYNGTAFSIETTNLPDGVSVAYENNGKTDVGVYTITAKFTGDANYNEIADMTATLTIAKATYDMSGVVFADKAVVYNGTAFSIEATSLPAGVSVTYENNGKTDVGVYTITAKFTGNANYNEIADMTATLTINKATYDMSGVVFADKTVVYNGTAFSIEVTNLPDGVSVTYENNGKTEAGVYTITAKFTGNENYNKIADMTATLTIKNASMVFNTNTENQTTDDVVVSAADGIDPTKELMVEKVEETEKYAEFIGDNQKVAIAYDIKMLKDGAIVQPDGTLQFRILIPEELKGKDFSIVHIHNGNETSTIEYQIDGDYVVFESDKLSEFIFVYEKGFNLSNIISFEIDFRIWIIIILIAIVWIGGMIIGLSLENKNKR